MEDMNSSRLIPTGWTFKSEVQKDGSLLSCYCYPGTMQEYKTYDDLMRYVEYAMAAKLGPYAPVVKSNSCKRKKKDTKDTVPTKLRKKSGSSRGRKPSSVSRSNSKSWTDDQKIAVESPPGNESDIEEDPEERTVSDSRRTDTDPSKTENAEEPVTNEDKDAERTDFKSTKTWSEEETAVELE